MLVLPAAFCVMPCQAEPRPARPIRAAQIYFLSLDTSAAESSRGSPKSDRAIFLGESSILSNLSGRPRRLLTCVASVCCASSGRPRLRLVITVAPVRYLTTSLLK